MSYYLNADAPHWWCMVEMDVLDVEAARSYITEQSHIEEKNGRLSYKYFVDDPQNPSRIMLLASYANDAAHAAHHENIRSDAFFTAFTNLTLNIFGNPPQSVIDRMDVSGYPAMRQMPYFMGFCKD